ncbi:HPr family phosphocarrier protein [Oscillospiraceae bacterium WX1]
MTYNVRVVTAEDALNLNKIAEKYPFDIWVHGNSGTADAKSLLGLMLLTIESELTLVVEGEGDLSAFERDIAPFKRQ